MNVNIVRERDSITFTNNVDIRLQQHCSRWITFFFTSFSSWRTRSSFLAAGVDHSMCGLFSVMLEFSTLAKKISGQIFQHSIGYGARKSASPVVVLLRNAGRQPAVHGSSLVVEQAAPASTPRPVTALRFSPDFMLCRSSQKKRSPQNLSSNPTTPTLHNFWIPFSDVVQKSPRRVKYPKILGGGGWVLSKKWRTYFLGTTGIIIREKDRFISFERVSWWVRTNSGGRGGRRGESPRGGCSSTKSGRETNLSGIIC